MKVLFVIDNMFRKDRVFINVEFYNGHIFFDSDF